MLLSHECSGGFLQIVSEEDWWWAVADQNTAELEEFEVEVGALLAAGAETCELVQPGKGALHAPVDRTEIPSATGVLAGDAWTMPLARSALRWWSQS